MEILRAAGVRILIPIWATTASTLLIRQAVPESQRRIVWLLERHILGALEGSHARGVLKEKGSRI